MMRNGVSTKAPSAPSSASPLNSLDPCNRQRMKLFEVRSAQLHWSDTSVVAGGDVFTRQQTIRSSQI